jgi:hypothetical protein
MSMHKYVVREQGGLWEVRLDGRLLSGQPTRREALNVAEILVRAAINRGEPATILVGTFDGVSVEFPAIEREARPA